MSLKIHHGYRIQTADPETFWSQIWAVVAPIRDLLDATGYDGHVAGLIDRRDQRGVPAQRRAERAHAVAHDLAVLDTVPLDVDPDTRVREIIRALSGHRVSEIAATIAPNLRTITAVDLGGQR